MYGNTSLIFYAIFSGLCFLMNIGFQITWLVDPSLFPIGSEEYKYINMVGIYRADLESAWVGFRSIFPDILIFCGSLVVWKWFSNESAQNRNEQVGEVLLQEASTNKLSLNLFLSFFPLK